LKGDHCFNAVSNFDWIAEHVKEIIIAAPLRSYATMGYRCLDVNLAEIERAYERREHTDALSESNDEAEDLFEFSPVASEQEPTEADLIVERSEPSKRLEFKSLVSVGEPECYNASGDLDDSGTDCSEEFDEFDEARGRISGVLLPMLTRIRSEQLRTFR
jgi:hypothetical protein